MPFIPHSPEALIPRSDSRNPATTCKGITSNGRPCRRSLAASPRSSPTPSPSNGGRGVLAVLSEANGSDEAAAAFFCWQHKEQATVLAQSNKSRTNVFQLQGRSSIDTLAERLGVLEVEEASKKRRKQKTGGDHTTVRRGTLPKQWQKIPGPLMAVPEESLPPSSQYPRNNGRRGRGNQQELHFSFFCCMGRPDTEATPPIKIRQPKSLQIEEKEKRTTQPRTSRPPAEALRHSASSDTKKTASYTQALLSFIPTSLPPGTTSFLLTELSKPLSASDREPGYIYIFWLTSENSPHPDGSTASALLSPSRPDQIRRTSDVLRAYAAPETNTQNPRVGRVPNKTIMLKIGRASNVQRRMNEWARQCGQQVSLVRYYPHHQPPSAPSSPFQMPSDAATSTSTPKKVPLVARVERLIHVELGARRVKRNCEGCGKEHREWFEVDATREGVKAVDEVVGRWVGWAEREGGLL